MFYIFNYATTVDWKKREEGEGEKKDPRAKKVGNEGGNAPLINGKRQRPGSPCETPNEEVYLGSYWTARGRPK